MLLHARIGEKANSFLKNEKRLNEMTRIRDLLYSSAEQRWQSIVNTLESCGVMYFRIYICEDILVLFSNSYK
jgi:hypothetical protein